jgi:hypothetical protein
MPLTIGVDESIIDCIRDQSYSRYIYVASCSTSKSGNVTRRDKEFSRKMQDGIPIGLYDRFHFLFRTFVLDPTNKGSFREKYFQTITSMIGETVHLTRELGIFKDDNLLIEIDGADCLEIKKELIKYLREIGYGDSSSVRFVIRGDLTKQALYFADTIAYFLRAISSHLTPKQEILSVADQRTEEVIKLLGDASGLTRKISPLHLHNFRDLGQLERKVA